MRKNAPRRFPDRVDALHAERDEATAELVAATNALLDAHDDPVAAYQRYERARARIADLTRGLSVGDDDDAIEGEGDDDGDAG